MSEQSGSSAGEERRKRDSEAEASTTAVLNCIPVGAMRWCGVLARLCARPVPRIIFQAVMSNTACLTATSRPGCSDYTSCAAQAAFSSDEEQSSSDEELLPEEGHAALLSDWRTAAIVHFTRCFSELLGMARPFPSEKLEEALEQPTEHLLFLGELVHRLVTSQPYLPESADAAWLLLQQAAKARLGMPANLDFFSLSPMKRVTYSRVACLDCWRALPSHVAARFKAVVILI